jgi:hypothetical protein
MPIADLLRLDTAGTQDPTDRFPVVLSPPSQVRDTGAGVVIGHDRRGEIGPRLVDSRPSGRDYLSRPFFRPGYASLGRAEFAHCLADVIHIGHIGRLGVRPSCVSTTVAAFSLPRVAT